MMYAIIVDGGRQYRVEPGMEVVIDYRDIPSGESLTFEKVLAVSGDDGLKLGQPTIAGATVTASVIGPALDKKLYIQKLRRRKNSRRRTGHRQIHTRVRIEKIAGV
jgi:large subunit ribosomal protein L21